MSQTSFNLAFHYGPATPLDPLALRVARWEDADITQYLQTHDIQVRELDAQRFLLVFPEGTQEWRRLPVLIHEYFRYTLPDGTALYSAHSSNGVSIAIDLDAFEQFRQHR